MTGIGRKPHTKTFGQAQIPDPHVCPRCGGTGHVAPEAITIGDRFRSCRIKLNKNQGEIASAVAISRTQIVNIEADRSRPGLELLVKAADVFGVSLDYLVRGGFK